MSWIPEHIASLIVGYNNNSLTETEKKELEVWKNESDQNQKLFDELTNENVLKGYLVQMQQYDDDKGWEKVKETYDFSTPVVPMYRKPWFRWSVAAAVLFFVIGGYWLSTSNQKPSDPPPTELAVTKDVQPPKSTKAVITLADGRQIELDSINSGTLAVEGNVNVVRKASGEIVYTGNAIAVLFNSVHNPRGSKVINLTLHDGTKVWLNNESSIRYPIAFIGAERKVEITGEAYLEVAKNPSMPFKVLVDDGSEVEVLGTHFNINAYKDEAVAKTTLLEGRIRFTKEGKSQVLKPQQQVQGNKSGKLTLVQNANTEEAVAWKNGYFHFGRADLPTVMKQLARWYDLDVQFEGAIPQREFGGELQRDLPLSSVLKLFEKGNVRFRIEGKKLTVLP